MALVSLFFKKPQKTQVLRTIGNSVTPLFLDATVKESFTATADPTQHPIEKLADTTDHVILRPKSLSISGVITETPFEGISGFIKAAGATSASAIGSSLGTFGGAASSVLGGLAAKSIAGSVFGSSNRDLGSVAAEFVKLRDARLPVDIQTGLQLYKNYVMSSFSCTRDKSSGGSINVDLEFKELILVESAITQVAIPKAKSALPNSNQGRQSKKDLTDSENSQKASLLKQIFGGG